MADGLLRRLPNRRIKIFYHDGSYFLEFVRLCDPEPDVMNARVTKTHRFGKDRIVTEIALTREAMETLALAFNHFEQETSHAAQESRQSL
jgi:hypothetical protein